MRDPENARDLGRESLPPEEEEEEEEWEEEDEEDDEDWEEEEEEEEEVEEEKKAEEKPAKEKMADKKEDEKAEEPKKDDKAKKGKEDKKEEKKKDKPAKAPKDDGPPPPVDPAKMGKTLFVVGLCLFFLATCAEKGHYQWRAKYDSEVAYYQGGSRKPIPPPSPFLAKSTNPEAEDRAKEQKELNDKYQEAEKEFYKSAEFKEYQVEAEEHRKWVHEHQVSLARSDRAKNAVESKRGNWQMSRFYLGKLGILLMIIGLASIMMKGSAWEKVAAILALGFGVLQVVA